MNSLLRLASEVRKGCFYSRVRFDLNIWIWCHKGGYVGWDKTVTQLESLCGLQIFRRVHHSHGKALSIE